MILGVCGKIASGKSEVLKILEKKGFYCIDADKIVYDLYKSCGNGSRQIKETFGKEYLEENGEVSRVKLRELVFRDPKQLKILNKVIHPFVYAKIQSLMPSREKNVAIEAVYFDEDFLQNFVNVMIWVARPRNLILRTLEMERNFSQDLAAKAVDLIQKPGKVDFIIDNSGSLADLEKRVGDFL